MTCKTCESLPFVNMALTSMSDIVHSVPVDFGSVLYRLRYHIGPMIRTLFHFAFDQWQIDHGRSEILYAVKMFLYLNQRGSVVALTYNYTVKKT